MPPKGRKSLSSGKPDAKSTLNAIYKQLVTATDKHDREISEFFMELPSEEEYPDYYEVIEYPISFAEIKQKIKSGDYSLKELDEDIRLLASNAREYNEKGSQVYKDSVALEKLFDALKSQVLNARDEREGSEASVSETKPKSNNVLLKIYKSLIGHKKDSRKLCELFEELPDEDDYPEYYEVIEDPISLKEIKKKIDKKHYSNIDDLAEDIRLMVDNAKSFNEAESEVYQDAMEIWNVFERIAGELYEPEDLEEELEEVAFKRLTYSIGTFVYLQGDDDDVPPLIGLIHRAWRSTSGRKKVLVNLFYRPEHIYSESGRKYYDKEVLKTYKMAEYTPGQLIGRCTVMPMDKYVKGRPLEWSGKDKQKDVFVCEMKYFEEGDRIEKVSDWKSCLPSVIRDEEPVLVPFDSQLKLERNYSPKVVLKRKLDESDEEEYEETDEEEEIRVSKKPRKRAQRSASRESLPSVASPPTKTATKAHSASSSSEQITTEQSAATKPAQQQLPPGQRPMVRPDELPEEILEKYLNKNGQILWFSGPPLIPPRPRQPRHSLEYLEWKIKHRRN